MAAASLYIRGPGRRCLKLGCFPPRHPRYTLVLPLGQLARYIAPITSSSGMPFAVSANSFMCEHRLPRVRRTAPVASRPATSLLQLPLLHLSVSEGRRYIADGDAGRDGELGGADFGDDSQMLTVAVTYAAHHSYFQVKKCFLRKITFHERITRARAAASKHPPYGISFAPLIPTQLKEKMPECWGL